VVVNLRGYVISTARLSAAAGGLVRVLLNFKGDGAAHPALRQRAHRHKHELHEMLLDIISRAD
jgi:hypothetical protein